MADLPRVSAIVLAWRDEPLLRRSVEALLGSVKVDVEVVLVDNGCTNPDLAMLAALPGVVVAGTGANVGFSAGCNQGVAASSGEYVALVNGDAIVEPTALARLVEVLGDPTVGIAAGAVRLADEPDLLNSRGNEIHVLGVSWVGGFRERDTRTEPTETAGAMGAFVVLRRAHWDRLGGFDEHYFAYVEDAEIAVRTWRLGLRVLNVPDAVALHGYEFSKVSFKYYLIERNRLMFVSTVWGTKSLVLLGPPLLALELVMTLLALKEGWLRDKLRGYGWLWRHRRHLRMRRRSLQAERVVPDREWMRVLTDRFDTPLINPPGVGVLNAAMSAYWRLISRHL
ncbi:glycosyltransferase family 2 protein [Phytohabitans rumicis]|uniref:Glycosyl transferase n=1 Tax=Phytohabitans rumicis TaxID=1076125 RepID=A0A6V8LG21_9ACTN|nr:glycosyltransferase family 2 protein [Phytohabitans rumicis]GFJ94600.1 glycosyl transferase [Phytohabitans rumicis]